MNKDVIYIDVEDDVTAIIGKIKASKESVVALVPPKRAGILQSAVNLRLLDRMASASDKHLVLITNNQALIALTAAAGIPVAKNLQSKPELAEITALNIDDDDDVIDGSNLPIGELAKTADKPKPEAVDEAIDELNIDDKDVDVTSGMGAVAIKKAAKSKNGVKVPNFNSFRKKLFIGIAAFIALVVFLVWANVFAPGATVIITAKTIATPISTTVTLAGATPTDVKKGTIQALTQTLKKDVTVKFTATGSKQVGTKATGTVTFSNCDSSSTVTIPSGTYLSSGGVNYVLQADTVVGAGSFSGGVCTSAGTSSAVSIVAADVGTGYNTGAGSSFAVSGYSAQMTASSSAGMSGGDSHLATVVTDIDVQKATDALNALKTDDAKKALSSQFTNGELIIGDSFAVDRGTPVSSPAVGAEATAPATLTSSTTYTINAIAKSDVELYLKDSLNKQIDGTTNQRIYDTGISKAKFTGYNKTDAGTIVNITAIGQIGPNIDTKALKTQIEGKKSGEVVAQLTNISGVDNVAVNFSYPWVTTIPNDPTKVDIQFKLTNG